jgi:hypothetical protein
MTDETAAGPMPQNDGESGSPVVAALKRYWWLLAVGGVVGLLVAVSMVYTIPGFEPREGRTYTAQSRLLVTSPEGQYVRVSIPREVDTGSSDGQGSGGGPAVTQVPPNVAPLLAAANLYPTIIVSDDVRALRTKMFGQLPGRVTANAFSAVSTPQRFSPAQLPVIDIFATAGSSKQAITLANATSQAFVRWIRAEQNRSGVKPAERILIRELQVPQVAIPSPGPSFGVPMLVAFALVAAFGFLAVVLDRLVPRTAEAGARPAGTTPAPEAPSPSPRWS